MLSPDRLVRQLVAAAAAAAMYAAIVWSLAATGGLAERTTTAGDDVRRESTGAWRVMSTDVYAVALHAGGSARLLIDGTLVQSTSPDGSGTPSQLVALDAGLHQIAIESHTHEGAPQDDVQVMAAPAGEPLQPLDAASLFTSMPHHPWTRSAVVFARALSGWTALLCAALLARSTALRIWQRVRPPLGRHLDSSRFPRFRRWTPARVIRAALVALVLAYGALLRFDAVTLNYGPVEHPAWLRAAQMSRGPASALRPSGMTWQRWTTRYISDPYTYLQYARSMTSFYAAGRREPLFVFATKVWLKLLSQQDEAVSFASMSFGVLGILGTFLLGRYAFSFSVGLGAAALMAIEVDLVTWSSGGWRDDAFAAAVVWSTYALLRCVRQPGWRSAAFAGVMFGAACLIRITSLSFVVPGAVYLLAAAHAPLGARLKYAAALTAITTMLLAPFLINCWRTYGDPLYSINVHADVYRASEGDSVQHSETAAEYLSGKLLAHPAQTIDTTIQGFTSYPFENKWQGFNPWSPALGRWLSWAALAGLVLFIWSTEGRLLLLVLAASMVPFAMTWHVLSDWRFTEHTYPFYLLAACLLIRDAARWCVEAHPVDRLIGLAGALTRKRITAVAAVAAAGAASVWLITRELPVLVVRESLRDGLNVTIMSGARDAAFFGPQWTRVVHEGNVSERISRGRGADMWIPLPARADVDMTLRLDPFPRPVDSDARLPALGVMINDHPLAPIQITSSPGRVGSYDVHVPSSYTIDGFNRLTLVEPDATGRSIRLWYVRVRPAHAR